jgi:hypothetical protein
MSYWCGTTRSITSNKRSSLRFYNGLACTSGDSQCGDEDNADDTLLVTDAETESDSQQSAVASTEFFEAGPPGLQAGISIQNLRKVTFNRPVSEVL